MGAVLFRKKETHCLTIYPDDAARRGLQPGECVYLFNEQGKARIQVSLSEDTIPGLVCLFEGM